MHAALQVLPTLRCMAAVRSARAGRPSPGRQHQGTLRASRSDHAHNTACAPELTCSGSQKGPEPRLLCCAPLGSCEAVSFVQAIMSPIYAACASKITRPDSDVVFVEFAVNDRDRKPGTACRSTSMHGYVLCCVIQLQLLLVACTVLLACVMLMRRKPANRPLDHC